MDTVGINMLIQAIAIGKENLGLTRKSNRRLKKEKLQPPFSSLTTDHVINLLKYGIELSKENLADLFWDAVWPRLRARGWNSKQRNFNFNDSKNSLVFLAPGDTKFSPSRQINGIHYFLSFADVLNRVSSEPQLIELDQNHDMLKPEEKQSSHREEVVQFFIVDSSLKYMENQIFKTGKIKSVSDSELSDEHDSSCETQNQRMVQSRDVVKYRIITKDSYPLAGKMLEGHASGSKYPLKRRRGVEERTDTHILE